MEYDSYRLYLAIDYQYVDMIMCYSLDQVEYELNRATGYNKYIVVGHNNQLDMDNVVATGTIEVNRPIKKR